MGVVDGDAHLECVVAPLANPQDVREKHRVADAPPLVILRVADHQPAFDHAVVKAVEAYLQLVASARTHVSAPGGSFLGGLVPA